MAQGDLDTRPDDKLDDELSPANREMPSAESISAGIDQLEAHANDPKNATKTDGPSIAEKEANAAKEDGNKTATNDKENLNYVPGVRKKPKAKGSGFVQKYKKKIMITASVSIVTALVAGFMAAPAAIMNQVSNLLTGNIGKVQISHQLQMRKKNFATFFDRFTPNGRRGGAIIADMRRAGFEVELTGGKVTGVKRPGSKSIARNADEIGKEFGDFMESRIRLFKTRYKNKGAEALYSKFGVERGSIVTRTKADADVPADEYVSKDIYNASKEGEHRTEYDPDTPPEEGEVDEHGRTAAEADQADADIDGFNARTGAFDEVEEWLAAGKPANEFPDQELMKAFQESDIGVSSVNLSKRMVDGVDDFAKVGSFAKGLANSTDIFDKMCTVNKALKAAVLAARLYRSISLMNAAFRYISADDGVKKGEAQADLLNEVIKRIVVSDPLTGGTFSKSTGYQFATTGVFSKSRNDANRAGYAVDGKTTGWQKKMTDITNIAGAGGSCVLWQNVAFQIGVSVAEIGLTIFSFGGAKAATTATTQTIKRAVEEGVARTMTRIITSKITRSLLSGVAIDIGFEQAIAITKLYTEKTLIGNVTGQKAGEGLSEGLFAGGGVANMLQSGQAGMPIATDDQYTAAVNRYYAERKEEMKEKSIFARYFDMENTDSLAASTFNTVAFSGALSPTDAPSMIGNFTTYPTVALGGIGQTIANTISPRAFAQDDDLITHDVYVTDANSNDPNKRIAIDMSGVPQRIMRDDILNIDPFENIEALLNSDDIQEVSEGVYEVIPKSELDNFILDCVETPDVISSIEAGKDCTGSLPKSKQFYAFLQWQNFLENDLGGYEHPEEIVSVDSGGENTTTPAPDGPVTLVGDLAFPLAVNKPQVGGGIFRNGDTDQAGHPYIAYDLIAAKGTTSVAMASGTIVRVAPMCDGNTAGITLNIPSQGISLWYGHQDPATILVSEGQTVSAGTPLAKLVDHTVDCASGADHLHIDASVNIGTDIYRPGCSRTSCTNQDRFRSIGPQLYELYQALPN